MLIDTHSHLYAEQFQDDLDEVIERARKNNIEQILLPNIDQASVSQMHALVDQDPSFFKPMMGLHPCSVDKNYLKIIKELIGNFSNSKYSYIAVGEIGIDLYWDKTYLKEQQEAFRIQIEFAKANQLPIVIHARESFPEIFKIVDELNDDSLRGIFHCFTGTEEDAKRIMGYGGFLMGIGGVVTFKNGGLDKVLPNVPLQHLVLETDAPYLAPVPFRGKRNESSYLVHILDKLADIYGRSAAEIAACTTANAKKMFRL